MALRRCEEGRDFGALVDHRDFFTRGAGRGGLRGDPIRVGDDAGGGVVAGAGQAVFADGIADAARDDEGNALVGGGQPCGGNGVGFVGVDEIKTEGRQELADLLGSGKAKQAAGDVMDGEAGGVRAFAECGICGGDEFGMMPAL